MQKISRSTTAIRDFIAIANTLLCLTVTATIATSIDSSSIHPWLLGVLSINLTIWIAIHQSKWKENRLYVGYIIFVTIISIYSLVPIALLANGFEIFPYRTETVKSVFVAHAIYINLLHASLYLTASSKILNQLENNLTRDLNKNSCSQVSGIITSLIGLAIAAAYLENYYSSGVSQIVGAASRLEIAQAAETGKTWLLQYMFAGWGFAYTWLLLNPHHAPKIASKAIALLAALIFLGPYFALGNRREFAGYLLFALILAITLNKKKLLAGALLVLPGVASISLLRGEGSGSTPGVVITDLFGEFIFPHYPLLFYAQSLETTPAFGFTYLRFPAYILPSFDLWEKAQSQAHIFIKVATTGEMGYAFTPLAEGFLNFGWLGALTTPILLSLTLLLLSTALRKKPLYWIVILAFSLDIARGEFIALLYQWVIYSTVIGLTLLINKTTNKKVTL